jgi:hypothetical protein
MNVLDGAFIEFMVIFLRIFIVILIYSLNIPLVWAKEVKDIYFPTDPSARLTESFGDARWGHSHEGEDMGLCCNYPG